MKHLKDLTWHPNWDEMAKQLATQAAGAAVAFVRLRAAMPSGPTCACRRCSAWAAKPKRMEMRPGPRYGVPWPLKRPSACSRRSAIGAGQLDPGHSNVAPTAGGRGAAREAVPEVVEAEELAAPAP